MSRVVGLAGEEKTSDKVILTIRRVIAYLVLAILVVMSIIPFYFLIMDATRSNSQIQRGMSWVPGDYALKNLKMVFSQKTYVSFGNVLQALKNSLIVSGLTAILSIYFSALTAYAIHVYEFKLKKAIHYFIIIVMLVPTQASIIGFYRFMIDLDLINTYVPLIVPSIAAPAIYFFMKQYMTSALPLDIVEAARIDGSNEFRTFNRIILPIMKPALAVQAIFTFVSSWNNYFLPLLILNDKEKMTVPVILLYMRTASPDQIDLGRNGMYILIAIAPVIVVYLALSKFIIRGIALGSVKG